MPESNSALLNAPMRKTVSKEKAPPIMKMRQRLYEPDTLMLPNEPWNPAARLLEEILPSDDEGATEVEFHFHTPFVARTSFDLT